MRLGNKSLVRPHYLLKIVIAVRTVLINSLIGMQPLLWMECCMLQLETSPSAHKLKKNSKRAKNVLE